MREVTKEQWHASIGQMDIIPRCEPEASHWETRSRELVGRTTPGYAEMGERRYYVADGIQVPT